ncbi:hypothetical protein R3P38DRAFT_2860301 [Favolaschia claudopus]|uniref:Uncharacterized protein n=1 Tax=Favolaschia claudopus TaxID=2862362 RepID=A0AAW0DIE6_9AGAR
MPFTSASSFNALSTELKYTTARFCSPLDLVQLAGVNVELRNIIVSKRLLQRSIAQMGGPTLVLNDSAFPGQLSSLVVFLFTESDCWACGKRTNAYPLSFSLRVRVCDSDCQRYLFGPSSDKWFATIPAVADRVGEDMNLRYIEPWAPFWRQPMFLDKKVYCTRQLRSALARISEAQAVGDAAKAALLEVNGPQRASDLLAFMEVARSLRAWGKSYEKERQKCASQTRRFFTKIRDEVWLEVRSLLFRAGPQVVDTKPPNHGKTFCSFCSKSKTPHIHKV